MRRPESPKVGSQQRGDPGEPPAQSRLKSQAHAMTAESQGRWPCKFQSEHRCPVSPLSSEAGRGPSLSLSHTRGRLVRLLRVRHLCPMQTSSSHPGTQTRGPRAAWPHAAGPTWLPPVRGVSSDPAGRQVSGADACGSTCHICPARRLRPLRDRPRSTVFLATALFLKSPEDSLRPTASRGPLRGRGGGR